MTIEKLQADMITAMKEKNAFRKNVLSMMIAQIKKSAIDKGCRDNITEEFINAELIKYQKSVKETVNSLPQTDERHAQACNELAIVNEYAPIMITDPDKICEIIRDGYEGPLTKKDLMKFLSVNYRGKMDMKVAGSVVDEIVKH